LSNMSRRNTINKAFGFAPENQVHQHMEQNLILQGNAIHASPNKCK
jgi:hypothetical protein